MKKIVYLSGGIGGAKLAKGFYNLKEIDLTIIINTGDDETIQGVRLSPDIDSVIYALAGIEGEFGWGQKNDSFTVSEEFKKYLPQEFNIGDKDLALNLFRNQLFSEGKSLTQITNIISDKFDLNCKILPMSNDLVSTKIKTVDNKLLDFQEYFVELKSEPNLSDIIYLNSEKADIATISVSTFVEFGDISAIELKEYSKTDEPLDKAGAYAIQGYAEKFIKGPDEKIEEKSSKKKDK